MCALRLLCLSLPPPGVRRQRSSGIGKLLFRKLRPEWAASPTRHSSFSRFALPKFVVLAQILGFADSRLERHGVLARLLSWLSRSEVHSCCELSPQKSCTRLNKINKVLPGCKKQLRAVPLWRKVRINHKRFELCFWSGWRRSTSETRVKLTVAGTDMLAVWAGCSP